MDKTKKEIADLREDYKSATLEESSIENNPFLQFSKWFEEAQRSEIREPNAMTLATATSDGRPSARIVLLKGITTEGFIFYTNYNSHKAKELIANPYAALVFSWLDLERQIRIEGQVEKLSHKDSEAYFQSRPKGSQIGAWASPQSEAIDSRQILEDNVKALKEKYDEEDQLPCPPHWGGFIVKPLLFEFWQGRSSRLHDRIQYKKAQKGWIIQRLAP